jgi:hypothetical protein
MMQTRFHCITVIVIDFLVLAWSEKYLQKLTNQAIV